MIGPGLNTRQLAKMRSFFEKLDELDRLASDWLNVDGALYLSSEVPEEPRFHLAARPTDEGWILEVEQ